MSRRVLRLRPPAGHWGFRSKPLGAAPGKAAPPWERPRMLLRLGLSLYGRRGAISARCITASGATLSDGICEKSHVRLWCRWI